jgi:Saccharopine dehydrogenase and related proteins
VDLAAARSPEALRQVLSGSEAIIMAGDAWAGAADVARLARRWDCHYLDVAESPASAEAVAGIAEGAGRGFAPGCGLAPGYVTALVAEHMAGLGPTGRITAHVGVLPRVRTNRLGYGNIWGIDGLLAEYTLPCLALRAGRRVALAPLGEESAVVLGGETFESFTTAGSLDALVARSEGRIAEMVFKTLRYPGHLDYIRLLLEDLGLAANRNLLRSLLMNGLPEVEDDRVLIALDVQTGPEAPVRRFEQRLDAQRGPDGTCHSAALASTAAHVCAMADLMCRGLVGRTGFLPQGSIPLALLRQSPFFASLDTETMHPATEV